MTFSVLPQIFPLFHLSTLGIMFDDGSFEDNIDLVVFATGYKVGYQFMVRDLSTPFQK